ncbi:hypothetical protein F2Q69_00063650 [Brassica cretica]|uniref:Endonuclease/exonuclease/phosphatase domain-containing protein n=1 Tax=Brassica cretica TaxID=69181 RepID=A0A8S9RCZ3_BRACR|nr:hypothetical protein F2Q69_00063650 [Brassica cretica]
MAKKKPPKGKPPNRSTTHPGSASRSTSASKPRAVSPHAAGSDSATGKRSTPARANSPLLRTTPHSLPHRSKSLENRQRSVSPISHHAQRVNPHSQTLAVETNDLVESRLVVDLTPYSSKNSISSGHVSDGSNFSGDEDPGLRDARFGKNWKPAPHFRSWDFKECIDECSLFDLPYCGNSFTWSNGHVSKKLDRILTNSAWLQQFPESIGVFGVPGISDHSPCCVFLDQHRPKQKRPFKFFAHLNQHEDFVEILEHVVDYYTLLLGGPTSSAAPCPSVIASFLPLRCSPEAVRSSDRTGHTDRAVLRASRLELRLEPRPDDRTTARLPRPTRHSKTHSRARLSLGREETEDGHAFSSGRPSGQSCKRPYRYPVHTSGWDEPGHLD